MTNSPTRLNTSDKMLLDEYLSGLEIQPHNTPKLFAVGFLGLPGTGKSTVANMISNDLGLPLNRSDQIRRFLNEKGFSGPSPRQDIMASLAEARTVYYYRNQTSVVIDANFSEYAASSRTAAFSNGAILLLIRIDCPDAVAIDRLRTRAALGDANDSSATADDFLRIKNRAINHEPVEDVYFTIDSTADIKPQLYRLYDKMRRDGFIEIDKITSIKAIISDADGTLVNTVDLIRHGQYEAAKRFYIKNGVAESDIPDFESYIAQLEKVIGASAHDTLRRTAELVFQSQSEYLEKMDFDDLTASLKSIQDEMAPSYVRAYAGLNDFLEKLGQRGIKFAIFTSGSRYEVTRNFGIALPELGLSELYKDQSIDDATKLDTIIKQMAEQFQLPDFTIVTFEDTERHKPNPDSLQLAMKRLGVEPREVMVMGDHAVDMLAAKSAGVDLRFGLTHGFHEEQALRESGATRIGHSLADVESSVLYSF